MSYFLMALKEEKITIAVLVDPRCEKNDIWNFLEELIQKISDNITDNNNLEQNQIVYIN